jgi:hypothetical protein
VRERKLSTKKADALRDSILQQGAEGRVTSLNFGVKLSVY